MMSMSLQRKRVLVVERLRALAERLVAFLREGGEIEIAGIAQSFAEAQQQLDRGVLDALVVDGAMCAPEALSFLRTARSRLPNSQIIVLMLADEPSTHEACRAAGADEVLLKDRDFEHLPGVLREGRSVTKA